MGKLQKAEEDEMNQVFYCGRDSQGATRIVGWIQVIISGALLLLGIATIAILHSLDETKRKEFEVWSGNSFLPCKFVYDGVLNLSLFLTFNFLVAFGCGFLLIEGAEKRRKELLFIWTLYIIITWLGNLLLICKFSLLLAQAFTIIYVTLYIIPYKVVQTLHEDILFYENLRAKFESTLSRSRSLQLSCTVENEKPLKDAKAIPVSSCYVIQMEPSKS